MTADTATPYQYHKHSLPSSDSHADAESLDIQQGLQLYHPETDLDIPQTEYHPAEQLHHRQAQELEVEGDGEVTGTSEASGGVEEGGDDWSSGGGGGDGGGQEVGGEGVRDGEEGEGEVGGDEDRVCEKPLVAAEDTLLTTADQLIPEDPIKGVYTISCVYTCLMRDEKGGRKKQARSMYNVYVRDRCKTAGPF